jgi:hypothetical protein
MSWLTDRKRVWRVILLALLAISILGPWGFDVIHVPAEFPCSAPHVRLSGDFCGLPLSLSWHLSMLISGLTYMITAEFTISFVPSMLLNLVVVGLPLLPLLSCAVMILRENGRRLHSVHLVLMGLALVGVSLNALLMGLAGRLHWTLWGLWLYLSTLVLLLALEIMLRRTKSATG